MVTKVVIDPKQKADRLITTPTGRQVRMSKSQQDGLALLCKKFHLSFRLESAKETNRFSLEPIGLLLNVDARAQFKENRRTLENYRRQVEELTRLTAERPRTTIMGQDVLERFVGSLENWAEVCEVEKAGRTLDRIPTKLPVKKDDFFGLRFWPVMFCKTIAGRELYCLTPPMPFRLNRHEITSLGDGHPHVHTDGRLCVGNARFQYNNPFATVPLLREWYVGYNPRDLADTNWPTHARAWWRANGEQFFNTYGERAAFIKAPWQYLDHSEVTPFTREMLAEYLRSGSDWAVGTAVYTPVDSYKPLERSVLGWATSEVKKLDVDSGEGCTECGAPARFMVSQVSGNQSASAPLCVHHAAEGPFNPYIQHNVGRDRAERQRLVLRHPDLDAVCNMPLCGNPWCTECERAECVAATFSFGTEDGTTFDLCDEHMSYCYGSFDIMNPDDIRVDYRRRRDFMQVELPPEADGNLRDRILHGWLGAPYQPLPTEVDRKFPRLAAWDQLCKDCGEQFINHWGVTCPKDAPYRLAPGSVHNGLGDTEAWSRFDFTDWDGSLPAEVNKDAKEGDKYYSIADAVKRSEGEESRRHWLRDILRKFGVECTKETRCIDCGRTWATEDGHQGPDCFAPAAQVRL